jgi:hypothetical protein
MNFTDNYQDRSTREGYQFEFFCEKCGNGHASTFKYSVTGFGGRLLRMGGDLVGGEWGGRASELGFDSMWMRDGVRGTARDKALAKAVEEMRPKFNQCHRCGQWACVEICWNTDRGLCTGCSPKLDQEIAGMQAQAQVDQLRTTIQQTDWTAGVEHQHEVTARCPSCQADSGGGRYCQHCGTGLAAAPPPATMFCAQCGTKMAPNALYCGGCGSAST